MLYKFADVAVDRAARQVHRGGEPVHLTRKAFDLLVLLIERRPEVVTKEIIHGHLWPDTFVSESSVQALVSEIRQVLGDAGRQAIRTVHGVGYAFSSELSDPSRPDHAQTVRAWLLAEAWRLPLYAGENIVGRGTDDIVTVDAPGISRRHARITVEDRITVDDLDSKNGTWVNDQRVTATATLSDGDRLRLGSVLFTFRLARGVDSTDTHVVRRETP